MVRTLDAGEREPHYGGGGDERRGKHRAHENEHLSVEAVERVEAQLQDHCASTRSVAACGRCIAGRLTFAHRKGQNS